MEGGCSLVQVDLSVMPTLQICRIGRLKHHEKTVNAAFSAFMDISAEGRLFKASSHRGVKIRYETASTDASPFEKRVINCQFRSRIKG